MNRKNTLELLRGQRQRLQHAQENLAKEVKQLEFLTNAVYNKGFQTNEIWFERLQAQKALFDKRVEQVERLTEKVRSTEGKLRK